MRFEKLNEKNYKKGILIGLVMAFLLVVIINLFTSKAAYRLTQSINIVDGTVSYSPYDFKIMEIYQQKEGESCTEKSDTCYTKLSNTDRMPSEGYTLNTSNSYCNLSDNTKDNDATLTTNEAGEVVINKLTVRDKCYLYYDKELEGPDKTLASTLKRETCSGNPDFTAIDEEEHKDSSNLKTCLYKAEDDFGESYYFRGVVNDNWVKFGKTGPVAGTGDDIWWRIIRINGDGSIRMIYAGIGASAPAVGGKASLINSNNAYKYNSNYNDDTYSKYDISNVKTQVDSWFNTNLNDEYATGAGQIDGNGKFCNDLSGSSSAHGALTRLNTNKNPSFICPTSGGIVITEKAALITADEVAFAGGLWAANNTLYYLNSGSDGYYWTMSPCHFIGKYVSMIQMDTNGKLTNSTVNSAYGIRPVINLKSSTQFTGDGTTDTPYTIKN